MKCEGYGTALQAQIDLLYSICTDDDVVKLLLTLQIYPDEAISLKKIIARAKSKRQNIQEAIMNWNKERIK